MERAEFAVRPRVAEIVGELLGLYVDLQRVGIGGSHVDASPDFGADERESENLRADENYRADNHWRGAAGEDLDLALAIVVGEPPDEGSQDELGSDEENAGGNHGLGHLMVDADSQLGEVGRHPVVRNEDRSRDDRYDRHDAREELAHALKPLYAE